MALLVTSCGFLGIGWNQWFSVVTNILEYQRMTHGLILSQVKYLAVCFIHVEFVLYLLYLLLL